MKHIFPILIAIVIVVLGYLYFDAYRQTERLQIENDILRYKLGRCEDGLRTIKYAQPTKELSISADTLTD